MITAVNYRKAFPARPRTDLWCVGVVHRPREALLEMERWAETRITWLPDAGNYRFVADPFGLCYDGKFSVLVEAYDYREKRGEIHYYTYDAAWKLEAQGVALSRPFHLSYPYLLRDSGDIYMLPEAHRSGRLTLYRARRFPDQWEEVAVLMQMPVVDACVVYHHGKWWMFYSPAGVDAMQALHVAHADRLTGPWIPHTGNPVRYGQDSSRPGGQPFVMEGALYLPVQDCSETYGSALQLLRIDALTPDYFSAQVIKRISPQGVRDGYADGLHTFSADGEVTLVDVKRIDRSYRRWAVNWVRRWRRLRQKLLG